MIGKDIVTATGLRQAVTFLAATCLLMTTALAADDLTQPIRVSENGRFLSQPDGQPFFWLGDTAWPLFQRLDRDDADKYLRDRAEKGFTVIQAVAWGGPWEGLSDRNRYGELPLIGGDPTRPNPRYFEHVDWIVDRAARYGLRMAMLPTWGLSMINRFGGDPDHARIFTPANAEAYGRWIAAHYRNKGVIWILGGDMIPLSPQESKREGSPIIDYRPIYDAMAKGIIEGDGGNPFISYHPCGLSFSGTAQSRTSLYFHDRDWLDMNMLQSSHFKDPSVFFKSGFDFGWNATFNYEPVLQEYYSTPVRPVIDGETRYEDEPIDVLFEESKGYWKAYDSRNAAYHAVFAGAAGHTYGNNSVHQFYDRAYKPALEWVKSPWQVELNAPGAQQMQHVKELMLSRPYFSRIPDQSLIVGPTGQGVEHVNATRDKDGSYAMIYAPQGQTITVDLSKISGLKAIAWWYDPRTGAAAKVGSNFSTTARMVFTPPTSGAENDWVLVLDDESKGFRAPGAKPGERGPS